MRKWGSAVLAAAMLASTASFAGTDARDQGALAPGGAAGVQHAETFTTPVVMTLVGIAAAAAVLAVILSSNNGSVTTTTTGSP
jgi:hypothetical protein